MDQSLRMIEWHNATAEQRRATAEAVFLQNNGEVTKEFYAGMNALGVEAQLAVALFRAQKRSEAAKSYRGKRFKSAAYDVKEWSLTEVCRIMQQIGQRFFWGWAYDAKAVNFEHVLYVNLPCGQVSFHSARRYSGPDFPGDWCKGEGSREHMLRFFASCALTAEQPRCTSVYAGEREA